jgi:hypothetical protein
MFDPQGLVVSLPAGELHRAKLPASVFTRDAILSAPFSASLRTAIDFILRSCANDQKPVLFVARTEMFPEGETLDWLLSRLGGAQDHLSISDGSTIKVIPGLRNHVFFHGLARGKDESALDRLIRRAPELLSTLTSQVNSAQAVRTKRHSVLLPTEVLSGQDSDHDGGAPLWRFYLNRGSVDDSINRILAAEQASSETVRGFSRAIYIPTVEAALADEDYAATIAGVLTKVYFDRETCLILGAPPQEELEEKPAERLGQLLDAIRTAPGTIPRIPANNVFLSTDSLSGDALTALGMPVSLILSDANPLWARSLQYYRCFSRVTLLCRRGRVRKKQFEEMSAKLIGRPFRMLSLRPELELEL